jgi:hypothetical protein
LLVHGSPVPDAQTCGLCEWFNPRTNACQSYVFARPHGSQSRRQTNKDILASNVIVTEMVACGWVIELFDDLLSDFGVIHSK